MADIARLTEVIAPEAEALGFELVRVKLTGSGDERVLQVMAEEPATGQLVVEQCANLSRRISARIDEIEESGEELIEGAYNLEVSSPGIDRPLTRAKDYGNWAGHEARLNLREPFEGSKQLVVELAGLDESGDATTIAFKGQDGNVHSIPLDQVHSAQLVLTDRLIAATQPLDMSGAEEIEEFPQDDKSEEKADT